ncbi:hypothetical protein CHU92_03335 [Flavobacterium cyanobacteriorum]|uniref:Uncharacterized protein n=1 Tax=Flavobacterium cyanobacteriorum TaxID=2022802 RepID=A0A255ZRJ4_9FLAO|nr:hypothetical protein [Flavobacterium cyanobacteriorum]OYQ43505.1 hypothetical protein CHU92_03335 [Flavobacterium cyanobacteriorum]
MKIIKNTLPLAAVALMLASCGNSNRASDGEAAPENIGPVSDSVGAGTENTTGQDTTVPAP